MRVAWQITELFKNERNQNIAFVFCFAILVFLDQFFKKILSAVSYYNDKFAFSLPLSQQVIYIIYSAVLLGIFSYLSRNYQNLNFRSKLAWVLILAGAFSNIVERILFGKVGDFIYIRLFGLTGIYNLADFYILAGVAGLILTQPPKAK